MPLWPPQNPIPAPSTSSRPASASTPNNQTLHQQAISILTALGEHDTSTELAAAYTRRLTAAGLLPTDAHAPLAMR